MTLVGNRLPHGHSVESYIRELSMQGDTTPFYKLDIWVKCRRKVLHGNHNECLLCLEKSPSQLTRATMVHHVMRLQDRPDLALSEFYTDESGQTRRQLMPLCHDCHERIHERGKYSRSRIDEEFPEMW